MRVCAHINCNKELIKKNNKYCSLDCSAKQNSINKKATKPKFRYQKICSNPECNINFGCNANNKFCSRSCAATYNNKKYPKRSPLDDIGIPIPKEKCAKKSCTNMINTRRQTYCCRECMMTSDLEDWLAGKIDGNATYTIRAFVRKYILERSNNTCEAIDSRTNLRCTEDRILQIDHIDGNWSNSTPENLRAICPTCHALTDTYGSKNMGNGRTWKKEYNQFNKKN